MIKYLFYIILILCGLKYIKPNLNNNITVISLVIVLGLYIIDLIIQKNNIENFSNFVGISGSNYYIAIRNATSNRSVGDRIGSTLYNSSSKSIGFIYFYNSTISTISDIYLTAGNIDKYIQIYVPENYYFLAEYGSTAITDDRYCYQSIKSVLDTPTTKKENTVGFRVPTNILYNGTYNKITRLYIFQNILVINNFNTNSNITSGSMLSATESAAMRATTTTTLLAGTSSIKGGFSDLTSGYIRFHYKSISIETANKNIQSTITDRIGACLKFTLNTTNLFNFTYLNKTLANYIKDLLTTKNEDTIIYMFIPVGYYLVAKYKDPKDGILCYSSSNSVSAKTTILGSASTTPYHGEYTEPIILRYQIEDSKLDSIYICKTRYCLAFGFKNDFYNSTTLSITTTPSALLSM